MSYERIYNYGLYARYRSPDELRDVLKEHPLDRRAIDWAKNQGVRMIVGGTRSKGTFSWSENPTIRIREDMVQLGEEDITIVHELHHVIVPGIRTLNLDYHEYDAVVEEASLPISKDADFMDYIKRTLPYTCPIVRKRVVFPSLPINLRIELTG